MENQKEIIKSLAVIESLLCVIILGISTIIIIFAESPIYIFCGLFLTLFSVWLFVTQIVL
jgi:hypothetical protein